MTGVYPLRDPPVEPHGDAGGAEAAPPRRGVVQGGGQGSTNSLAALALLADKLKSHGQILTKIMYILSRLCMENVRKGIRHRQRLVKTERQNLLGEHLNVLE